MQKTIVSIVGARPNFMKLAPVDAALNTRGGFRHLIVHTGQHYDYEMSKVFFEELAIPEPHHHLDVGSGPHGEQTGKALTAIERVLMAVKPALVLVYGDVNSTLAGALAAVKLHIPVGHVEAGFRSFDLSMPEEVNRKVADCVSDWLFTSHPVCDENLVREGAPRDRIFMVGDTLIDSLQSALGRIRALDTPARMGLRDGEYVVVTLHRPSNVDDRQSLAAIIAALGEAARTIPIVFPVHPRTRARLREWFPDAFAGESGKGGGPMLTDPLGYTQFIRLILGSRAVLTDSGGVQRETSFLGVPCLTLRETTELTYTTIEGTNRLIGKRPDAIADSIRAALAGGRPAVRPIAGFDGHAADRIAAILAERL
ncbi:MAG: UDP-N-acetylglucosamine 2-epimerase (non-hydrolyzing) [Planctomycetota bacterium]|nr:UDP-N-acetylglucosamine 2-epimerase (non-hydrolyzing) [Planctomycetota bacterium]